MSHKAPLLFQKPTLSRDQVAFALGGDLWTVPRTGGQAVRLTVGAGIETEPHFSPDGNQIAFSGQYDGNTDVYVVDASGGVPRRLTFHPGDDVPVGWTPDGQKVLFRSNRESYAGFSRLFLMPIGGGFSQTIALPMAFEGSFSSDGGRIAYVPRGRQPSWRRYRGGQTLPVILADLSDSSTEIIPRENSNDFNPMWIGEVVYFLSDRDGPVHLFAYDTTSRQLTRVLDTGGRDLKSASAGPGGIVYEHLGALGIFNLETGEAQPVDISLNADLLQVRPRYVSLAKQIRTAGISPTGARAVFEARGEILTVPVERGDIRNLTRTTGAAERYPAWSPDGQSIAYFSDASGEYMLHIRDQAGKGEARTLSPGGAPSYYYSPVWSPDSKKIAYTDKRLNLWYVDLEHGASTQVDTDFYDTPWLNMDPAWSPESQWIVYTRQLENHLNAVFVFSLDSGSSHQVTDGMSDARFACFDRSGKQIYFTASTDVGLAAGWLDLSSQGKSATRSVYLAVLSNEEPSPLAPRSDEEKPQQHAATAAEGEKKPEEKPAEPVRIDLDGIDQRIVAMPIPAAAYVRLVPGKAGVLWLLEQPRPQPSIVPAPTGVVLHRFDLAECKFERVLEKLRAFDLSANGEKMLYQQEERWAIAPAPAKPGEPAPGPDQGVLKLDGLEVRVDPPGEWRQIYREVWRIQRDFLYDPGWHGLNLEKARAEYEPYLENLASRADLNYLFQDMLSHICIGHMYIGGGDLPETPVVRAGLLGADFTVENGRYRFSRIFTGENWNPDLKAPLTQPGVNVVTGEYLLAVNGQEVRAPDNVYAYFEKTAGKSVTLRVGPEPDGAGREVVVTPIESEGGLRNRAWIESNRRRVDEATNGRVAYVYLPNTADAGYTYFNRYYFAQVGKQAAIIDERFNGGGQAADYIVDLLRRPLLSCWTTREGGDFTTPLGAIFGPKVMIINESAGSGGDALPWYFRKLKIGPLVGTRTWGGLIGIYSYPQLIDGGSVTAPRLAFYDPDEGAWDVENNGVSPDVEVEFDPAAWREGRDTQLEKAIELVLASLEQNPPPPRRKPAYPIYH